MSAERANAPLTREAVASVDVVIVGAGIAGLTAAWQLRDRAILVLESESRPGGRMLSRTSDGYWLNLGPHLFPGPTTVIGRLADEFALPLVEVPDLMALALDGRIVSDAASAAAAARSLTWRELRELAALGARLAWGVRDYHRTVGRNGADTLSATRLRRLAYRDDTSLGAFLALRADRPDSLGDDLVRTATHRSGAEPDEMAAGAGLSLFAHVWNGRRSVTARNLVGGTEALAQALASALGDRVRLGTTVQAVAQDPDGLRVVCTGRATNQPQGELRASYAILATPAPVTAKIVRGLPHETVTALGRMRYGNYVCVAMFTTERGAQAWDRHYAIATPGLAFDLFVNDARVLRSEDTRASHGAVHVVAGGQRAACLWDKGDDEIVAIVRADLDKLFPGLARAIESTTVQRWEYGNAYSAPGRAVLQPALEAPMLGGRVHLAGDYFVEDSSMDGAAEAGWEAARRIRVELESGRGLAA